MSQNGATAQDLLGLRDVVVELPCDTCSHRPEQHADGHCSEEHALVGVDPPAEEGGKPQLRYGPCPCTSFEGAHENGLPRAVKLRMPSNMEWSSIRKEFSLPVKGTTPPDQQQQRPLTQEQEFLRQEWARKLVMISVTHLRKSDGSWQRVRVVARHEDVKGDWDICIETLDRAGGQLVEAIALQLVFEFNDGGHFGGEVRNFRTRRDGDLRVAVKRMSVNRTARVDVQPQGRTGGVHAPNVPGGDDALLDLVPPRAGDATAG